MNLFLPLGVSCVNVKPGIATTHLPPEERQSEDGDITPRIIELREPQRSRASATGSGLRCTKNSGLPIVEISAVLISLMRWMLLLEVEAS